MLSHDQVVSLRTVVKYLVSPVLLAIVPTAALGLFPASTPKGPTTFYNIPPSIEAKADYLPFLNGNIRHHPHIGSPMVGFLQTVALLNRIG